MSTVTIILPETSGDEVTTGLRFLTEKVCEAMPDLDGGFGLGGPNGYGVNYENDAFVMRRFYWGDCDCGFYDREEEFSARHDHLNVPWGEFNATDDHSATCSIVLPNFRHKASGFEVRWYKWIGRDNEIEAPEGSNFRAVLAECLASLPALSSSQGRVE